MNKTAIRRVAAAILAGTLATRKRGEKIGFNMGPFYKAAQWNSGDFLTDQTGHNCGTIACIAGWTHFMHGGKSRQSAAIATHAREVLGLTQKAADHLFCPFGVDNKTVTAQQAALVLYHLAATGKVDWDISRPAA